MKSVAEHLEEFRAAVRGYPELTEANRTLLDTCFLGGFIAAITSFEIGQIRPVSEHMALVAECEEINGRNAKAVAK